MDTESNTLVPVDEYLNSGVHVGTKFKNNYMAKYIFKSRADGLKVIDTGMIDSKIRNMIKLVSNYDPSEIAVFGRRESAKRPIKMLGKIVGCDVFPSRYLPGSFTNPALENFREYKLIVISDPLTDKNILSEAFEQGITIVALCDTNNVYNRVDLVVPINNKGKKSLAMVYYLLSKHYMANRGLLAEKDFKFALTDFYDE